MSEKSKLFSQRRSHGGFGKTAVFTSGVCETQSFHTWLIFGKSAIAPNNCICFIKTVYSRSECERDAGHDQHKHDRETLQEPTGFNQETSETHSQYYISHNYFTEYTQHIHKNHNFDSWKTFLKTTNNIYKIFLVFKKI